MAPPQHRIFVSHSHLDNEFGTRLTQDLRRVMGDERAVFYDVLGGLHGGDSWWEKIVEELAARDVFILVLSPHAMNSKWVRLEINVALNEGKYIIPVLHRPCNLRVDLKTIQSISFLAPKAYEVGFQEVLSALGLPPEMPATPKVSTSPTGGAAATLLRQIDAAFAAQDWPDVIRKADYLIKRLPESETASVYRLQGLAYLEEGEEQHAQEALETALALVDDRELRLTLLSDYTALLARQKQWARVLKRAREALRLVPNDPGWLAMQQQAQNELAGEVSGRSLSHGQGPATGQKPAPTPQKTKEEWLEEGNNLYTGKRYEEALAAYEQVLRLDPNYAPAYLGKGNVLRDFKRYEEALAACEQALRLDPNYAMAYNNKGNALGDLTRSEEALAAYEQALHLNPNLALAYYGKGNALRELMRSEEALAAYEQALHLDPNFAWAYNAKGNALRELMRPGEALAAYEQALRLDPNYAVAYNGKGSALGDLKRYEEALVAFEQALRLDPNYALAYYNQGIALNYLKRYEEALAACQQALRLDPNYAPAYVGKGNALRDLKRYEEALAAYEQALRLDPNLALAYNNMGNALYDLKRYE